MSLTSNECSAFDVLDRMKAKNVERDDYVYRALIDAACRIGSTKYAMTVLKEMRHDRIRPSALFFSCLLSAFAMDGSGMSGTHDGNDVSLKMKKKKKWKKIAKLTKKIFFFFFDFKLILYKQLQTVTNG